MRRRTFPIATTIGISGDERRVAYLLLLIRCRRKVSAGSRISLRRWPLCLSLIHVHLLLNKRVTAGVASLVGRLGPSHVEGRTPAWGLTAPGKKLDGIAIQS